MKALYFLILWTPISLFSDIRSTNGTINFNTQLDNQADMTLNSTGLGIGITPASNLHVDGNALISEQMFVGGSSGSSNLNVNGTFGFSIQTISSNITLSENTINLVDTSGGNITVTLPYAGNVVGRVYIVKKMDLENTVKLETSGNFIDSYSYFYLTSGNHGSINVVANDDGNWYALNENTGVTHAWTPSEINTALWLDSSDSATVLSGVAGNVYQWSDKSGSAIHGTQSTAVNQPTTGINTIAGMNTIFFDGTDDAIYSGIFSSNLESIEVYIAFQANVLTDKQLFDVRTAASGNPLLDDSARAGFRTRRRNDSGTIVSTGQQTQDLNAHIGYYAYDAAADLLLNRLDGQNELTVASSGNTTGDFHIAIGNNGSAISTGFNGWVCEVIVLNSISSTAIRQNVEAYLAWKWGLEGNLDNSHPYKSVAP
jgi:hypothetical protein